MDLLMLLFVIALVGLGVYLLKQIPMDPIFSTAINIIAIVFVILYLFKMFSGSVPNVL